MEASFNLAASISSIIIAVVAIAQATYYFTKTKSSEERVAVALAEIRSATQSLEKLNMRYVDRLTKHLTDSSSRQFDDVWQITRLLSDIPKTYTDSFAKSDDSQHQFMLQEKISLYILLHHYCALTNLCAQLVLPPVAEIDGNNNLHARMCEIVDMSSADFLVFDEWLKSVQPEHLEKSPHMQIYDYTVETQKRAIKNMGQMFVEAQTPR